MECSDFALRLDDLLDGRLHALGRKSIEEHLGRCPDCRQRYEHAVAVLEAVRKLSPPALHPGFIDQALSRATRPAAGAARPKWRPMLGMALAASLVLGVALGVFFATRPDPVQAVALTIDRPAESRHLEPRATRERRARRLRQPARALLADGFARRREPDAASLDRARSDEGGARGEPVARREQQDVPAEDRSRQRGQIGHVARSAREMRVEREGS